MTTQAPLWAHQQRAIDYVSEQWRNGHPGVLLDVSMRAGKSRISVELIKEHDLARVLIVSLLSVVPVWAEESVKWGGPPVETLDSGSVAQKAVRAFNARKVGRAIAVNYDSAFRGALAKLLLGFEWDLVVWDEVHKLKQPGGQWSRFAARIRDRSRYRLGLSGTLLPHSPLDAYGIYRAIDQRVFGTSNTAFKNRYANFINVGFPKLLSYKNLDELHEKMYSIAFHAGREALDLATPVEMRRYCELGPKAMKAYRDLEREFVADLEGGSIVADNALVRILRLSQVASGIASLESSEQVIDSAKEDLLAEVLEEIGNESVVVFCRFKAELAAVDRVSHKLGRMHFELSGAAKGLELWKRWKDPAILAVQYQSGGVGIDLSKARHAIFFSPTWSLADFQQAQARLERHDQKEAPAYIYLVARSTVDTRAYQALAERKEIIKSVVQSYGGGSNGNTGTD